MQQMQIWQYLCTFKTEIVCSFEATNTNNVGAKFYHPFLLIISYFINRILGNAIWNQAISLFLSCLKIVQSEWKLIIITWLYFIIRIIKLVLHYKVILLPQVLTYYRLTSYLVLMLMCSCCAFETEMLWTFELHFYYSLLLAE